MAAGNQPTVSSVNNVLTALAVQLRQAMDAIRIQNTPITNMGAEGLEALGFDSGDAAAVLSAFSYLSTVSQVYYGTAAQPSEFDFDNELSQFWAGQ